LNWEKKNEAEQSWASDKHGKMYGWELLLLGVWNNTWISFKDEAQIGGILSFKIILISSKCLSSLARPTETLNFGFIFS